MRGFATLGPEPGDLMTWLNSDDLLAPGALASVASCLAEIPSVTLCGGRVSMIDALGRVVRVNAPVALSRKLLAAGLYDGRRMPFVMQEGTFWRQELWSQVGGLNPTFRLAGDWDLWRRMAHYADYVTLDVLTAFHRRRPGQLSEESGRLLWRAGSSSDGGGSLCLRRCSRRLYRRRRSRRRSGLRRLRRDGTSARPAALRQDRRIDSVPALPSCRRRGPYPCRRADQRRQVGAAGADGPTVPPLRALTGLRLRFRRLHPRFRSRYAGVIGMTLAAN